MWVLPGRASIRSSAILAQCSVSSSTSIWLTTTAVDQRLHRPDEVRQVDAVHRRAVADGLVEEDDPLVRVGCGEALDQVELGADRPGGAGGGGLDRLDDELGRTDQVRGQDDLVGALGVHDDLDAGDRLAQRRDRVGGEPAVHGAVALPEDHLGVAQLVGGEAAVGSVRVPHHAVVEGHAQLEDGGVAAEVLVGEEQHLRPLLVGPLERGLGVRRRADRAAVLAAERLDVGARVHVGHRDDVVGDAGRLERGPGVLDLAQPRHVGHRAAGRQVGKDHLLLGRGQDVGRLGHEVHAAEDDELRVRPRGRLAGQLERVAGDVGELDDLVALVVVAEHEDPLAERCLGGESSGHEVRVGRRGQVAGALHASLGLQVHATAQRKQREVDGRHAAILVSGRRLKSAQRQSRAP